MPPFPFRPSFIHFNLEGGIRFAVVLPRVAHAGGGTKRIASNKGRDCLFLFRFIERVHAFYYSKGWICALRIEKDSRPAIEAKENI